MCVALSVCENCATAQSILLLYFFPKYKSQKCSWCFYLFILYRPFCKYLDCTPWHYALSSPTYSGKSSGGTRSFGILIFIGQESQSYSENQGFSLKVHIYDTFDKCQLWPFPACFSLLKDPKCWMTSNMTKLKWGSRSRWSKILDKVFNP